MRVVAARGRDRAPATQQTQEGKPRTAEPVIIKRDSRAETQVSFGKFAVILQTNNHEQSIRDTRLIRVLQFDRRMK